MSYDVEARLCSEVLLHERHPWAGPDGQLYACSGQPESKWGKLDWDQMQSALQSVQSWCGVVGPGGLLCSYPLDHYRVEVRGSGRHSWQTGQHVEQAAPVPNDQPSSHDLVVRDILSRDLKWDLSVGTARHIRDRVAEDLEARKQLGLDRYGSILQAHNGRDMLRDAYEEAQDLAVYLRGCLSEIDESSLEYLVLFEIYDDTVTGLVRMKRVQLARQGSPGRGRDAATE